MDDTTCLPGVLDFLRVFGFSLFKDQPGYISNAKFGKEFRNLKILRCREYIKLHPEGTLFDLPCLQPLLRVFVALAGTDSVSVETCLFEYPVEPSHDQQVVVFRRDDENRGVSGSRVVEGGPGVGEQSTICTGA